MGKFGDQNVSWGLDGTVKDGVMNDLKKLMIEMCTVIKKEEGSLVYEWSISDDNKHLFVYERYVDEEAAKSHLQTWAKYQGRFSELVEINSLHVYKEVSPELKKPLTEQGAILMRRLGGFSEEDSLVGAIL